VFAGVRDTKWESKLLSSVPVESVAEQLKPLLAQGWRPIAIAIDSNVLLTLRREDDAGTAITTERDEYKSTDHRQAPGFTPATFVLVRTF